MYRYFLRQPAKIISHDRIGKSKVVLLTATYRYKLQPVNMPTHFYPLPRLHPYISFTAPIKVTVNALEADCQSFYRKIYRHFCPPTLVEGDYSNGFVRPSFRRPSLVIATPPAVFKGFWWNFPVIVVPMT